MPPRTSLFGCLQHPSSYIKTQVCHFSRNAPSQAVRRNIPTAANQMLGLDSTSRASTAPRNATLAASDIFESFRNSKNEGNNRAPAGEERTDTAAALRGKNTSEEYMRQMPRRFNLGDLYAPHDLSPTEMRKWRKITTVERDLVDLLGIRPLDMYRNFSFISEYITQHGRIKRADQTGLRPVNQRKVAKAIRRAIGLGIHPSVHRHPELLMREARTTGQQNVPTGQMSNFYKV